MSDRLRLAQAQRVLDRCDGNLFDAIGKAAFRNVLLAVLAEGSAADRRLWSAVYAPKAVPDAL
jgi:hypothetical protein